MSLEIIALSDLLEEEGYDENDVQNVLNTFRSIRFTGKEEAHDVEDFIKRNAILFNKTGIASTHLIFSDYKGKPVLVAYFTIANKDLYISKRNLQKLSKSMQKKIKQRAQLGKNFSQEALLSCNINGKDILEEAFKVALEAKRIVGGSFVWIEYEDTEKLRAIYESYGFSEIPNYTSPNNLKLAIKQLK